MLTPGEHGILQDLLRGGHGQRAGRHGPLVAEQLHGATFRGHLSLGDSPGECQRLIAHWANLCINGPQWPLGNFSAIIPVLNVGTLRGLHDFFRLQPPDAQSGPARGLVAGRRECGPVPRAVPWRGCDGLFFGAVRQPVAFPHFRFWIYDLRAPSVSGSLRRILILWVKASSLATNASGARWTDVELGECMRIRQVRAKVRGQPCFHSLRTCPPGLAGYGLMPGRAGSKWVGAHRLNCGRL